jgi:hypothetical protein
VLHLAAARRREHLRAVRGAHRRDQRRPGQARAAVGAYLSESGAYARYPGLSYTVRVDGDRVVVRLHAPLDLPLSIPGSPERATIGAEGSAVVGVDD